MLTRELACRFIQEELAERHVTIADEIARTKLYFRVSVIGGCNLSCPFCHNEGGPKRGIIDPTILQSALIAAATVGFTRVQFTGGEPTLHPHLDDLIRLAKSVFNDVGVTTNGTRLDDCLIDLIVAGLNRLHISVQQESMVETPTSAWRVPEWLDASIRRAAAGMVRVQINLPVAAYDVGRAEAFLLDESTFPYDWKVFALLPTDSSLEPEGSFEQLVELVRRVDELRRSSGATGTVFIRGYHEPRGVRCISCDGRPVCREQSRSLRLGTNHVLRPCLATRAWDMPFNLSEPVRSLQEAALLALDFEPRLAKGVAADF